MADRMTPGRKLPPAAWITLLVLFAIVSWAIVIVEYQVTHHVSLATVAPALMFTCFVVLWPFLGGLKAGANGIRQALACQDCGSISLPTPGISFCIRCGAYPHDSPQYMARHKAPAKSA